MIILWTNRHSKMEIKKKLFHRPISNKMTKVIILLMLMLTIFPSVSPKHSRSCSKKKCKRDKMVEESLLKGLHQCKLRLVQVNPKSSSKESQHTEESQMAKFQKRNTMLTTSNSQMVSSWLLEDQASKQ
jgi:hypothetical protein